MLDPVTNFAKVIVSTGYDDTDTSIVLGSGDGAKLPNPAVVGAFNLVWWNATDYPDPSDDPDVEIVRVSGLTTDTLTVTRAQEGTAASNKNIGGKTYRMILGPTKKTIDDIEALASGFTAGSVLFADSDGYITEDNANLFWNDTENRLGIGTDTPELSIHTTGDVLVEGMIKLATGMVAPFIQASSNNDILIGSTGGGVLDLLQFGGITADYPAIQYQSAQSGVAPYITTYYADDSGYINFKTGGLALVPARVTTDQTPINVTFSYFADATAGDVDITLPAPDENEGQLYLIKKIDSSANIVNIIDVYDTPTPFDTLTHQNDYALVQAYSNGTDVVWQTVFKSSLGAGVATFLDTPSSANLAAAVTNETGSGSLVFGTAPTLSSPYVVQNNTSTTPATEFEQLSTGDVATMYSIAGDSYAMGIDNSDSDKFKLSYAASAGGAVLGTNDYLVVDSIGDITLGTGITVDRSQNAIGVNTTSPTYSNSVHIVNSGGVGLMLDSGSTNQTLDISTRGDGGIRIVAGGNYSNGPSWQFWATGTAFQGMYFDAGSASGANLNFRNSPGGSNAITVHQGSGAVQLGFNTFLGGMANRSTTQPTNALSIYNGTAPVGTMSNGITLYSTSGELRVMDAAGNATLLSPHDPETNKWIFDSHVGLGEEKKRIIVNMQDMMYALDEMLGGGFITEEAVAV